MPLRASCSFQLIISASATDAVSRGLNAPQGFMLIPTMKYSLTIKLETPQCLNAPQGFMLIPTFYSPHHGCYMVKLS